MKDFTMSKYASKENLYKAQAEYYEQKLKYAVMLLADALSSDNCQYNFLGLHLHNQIEKFIGEMDE
jgi:hypothetical protein